MTDREPNFEERLAAIKFAAANFDQSTESDEMPGSAAFNQAVALIEMMPKRPKGFINEVMTQLRELRQEWRRATSPEQKTGLKVRIKAALDHDIETIERSPK